MSRNLPWYIGLQYGCIDIKADRRILRGSLIIFAYLRTLKLGLPISEV
jgi:hypothetical protein